MDRIPVSSFSAGLGHRDPVHLCPFASLALDHIRRIGAHYGAYLPQD